MNKSLGACLLVASLGIIAQGDAILPGLTAWDGAWGSGESAVTVADVKPFTGLPPKAAADLKTTRYKAESGDSAMSAMVLWQAYVDAAAAENPDLPEAREELARWKKMAAEGAEKVGGKWISGEEAKTLHAKVNTLLAEVREMMDKDQTVQAMGKLQQVVRLYPNDFDANAILGFINLKMDKPDDAMKYLRQALKVQPQAAGCISCMGVVYVRQRSWQQALASFNKAAEIEDSEDIVQNLIAGVANAPPAALRDGHGKKALETARLLQGKYKLRTGPNNAPTFVFPRVAGKVSGPAHAGMMWNGTGFLINEDGLILTNRHVAKGATTLTVVFSDKTTVTAQVVAIDDAQDLALISVKTDKKRPYLRLCSANSPNDGADCTVLGFPLADRLGTAVKVTKGIVTTGNREDPLADVVIDAKVNPGNSGGPILNKLGQVMAIVSMKSRLSAMEDSYGMGIGAGRIRQFLAKNNVKLEMGSATAEVLSTEDVAAMAKPATVCILGVQ